MVRLRLLVVALLLGAGCGLISSDIDDFRLGFPERDFTVDTAGWNLQGGTGTVPAVPCSAGCENLESGMCPSSGGDCTADCQISTGNCQGHVGVSMRTDVPINLAVERPEFQTLQEQGKVINVHVETVEFTITENSLNLATPPLTLWFGPITATSPTDAGVVEIGQIATIPAGTLTTVQLETTPTGKAAMEMYMSDYTTPFNIMVGGTFDVTAGQALPTGRLVGHVTAEAFADVF